MTQRFALVDAENPTQRATNETWPNLSGRRILIKFDEVNRKGTWVNSPSPGEVYVVPDGNPGKVMFVNLAQDLSSRPTKYHAELRRDYTYDAATFTLTEQIIWHQSNVPTKQDVKDHAGAVILAFFPEHKQRNMIARAVSLLMTRFVRAWTPEEAAEVAALVAIWDWIGAVRSASDLVEQDYPNIAVEFRTDDRWPGPPPGV